MSWQPLHTPREKVSSRVRKCSNCACRLNLILAAQPLAESSTSAYEKPPTKAMPRNLSSVTRPLSRSDMVTSHVSSPPANMAPAMSRSPFDPSSRRMATRGLPEVSARRGAGVGMGVNVSGQLGVERERRPRASARQQTGSHCRSSSSSDVRSHTSRSSTIGWSSTDLPSTLTTTRPPASPTTPIVWCATPARSSSCVTVASCSAHTSTTTPTSSAKRRASVSTPSGAARLSSRPTLPAKAISSAVVSSPPSERSCAARMCPLPTSACIALKSAPSLAGEDTSGVVSPSCLYVCASDEPPRRWWPSPMCSSSSNEPACLKSGVAFFVTSGTVQ
mmetsp:Transcript_14859/g.37605  ORF Transcript_14859/g.37605 Transcript_14859/m.37605 type:complete len:333 (+) Transcript_14859:813-1811(+)